MLRIALGLEKPHDGANSVRGQAILGGLREAIDRREPVHRTPRREGSAIAGRLSPETPSFAMAQEVIDLRARVEELEHSYSGLQKQSAEDGRNVAEARSQRDALVQHVKQLQDDLQRSRQAAHEASSFARPTLESVCCESVRLTGLDAETLRAFVAIMGRIHPLMQFWGEGSKLDWQQGLLLTLIRLKSGASLVVMATLFGISRVTAGRYFRKVIVFLSYISLKYYYDPAIRGQSASHKLVTRIRHGFAVLP